MGRWSQFDEDDYRLPLGMTRIGYDADTQVYTYKDHNGRIWEGEPGCRYGTLRPVDERPDLDRFFNTASTKSSDKSAPPMTVFPDTWDPPESENTDSINYFHHIIQPVKSLRRSLTQRVSSATAHLRSTEKRPQNLRDYSIGGQRSRSRSTDVLDEKQLLLQHPTTIRKLERRATMPEQGQMVRRKQIHGTKSRSGETSEDSHQDAKEKHPIVATTE